MRKFFIFPAIVALLACACVQADTLWDYQAVNEIGLGTHPVVNAPITDPANRVTVEGVALAGVDEILDPSDQYTIFIQDEHRSRGGMQGWTGSWFYGALWDTLRATDYIDFQAGDKVRMTGFLADPGRGKVVMNNRHSTSPALIWSVEVIGHAGLPDPLILPSIHHATTFDATRSGGGERYQTRLVMLDHAEVIQGNWVAGQNVSVQDSTGAMPVRLSVMGDFNDNPPPSGPLNFIGIYDQEDPTAPHTGGYRLWVKRMSDIALSLKSCREVEQQPVGQRVALVGKMVSRTWEGRLAIQDPDRSGGVIVLTDKDSQPGDVVTVQGLVTIYDGQLAIQADYLFAGGPSPKPLFVNSRALWAEEGLSADGLLVSASVTMGASAGNGLTSLIDDAGRMVLARTNNWTLPAQGTAVIVTGVLSRQQDTPLLLPGDPGDFRVVE